MKTFEEGFDIINYFCGVDQVKIRINTYIVYWILDVGSQSCEETEDYETRVENE